MLDSEIEKDMAVEERLEKLLEKKAQLVTDLESHVRSASDYADSLGNQVAEGSEILKGIEVPRNAVKLLQEQLQELIEKNSQTQIDLEAQMLTVTESTGNLNHQVTEGSEILEHIEEQKNEAMEFKLEIYEELKNSKESAAKLTRISETIDKLEEREAEVLARLEGSISKCEAQEKTIENLLPGATSAGLASAFNERKESFSVPKIIWGTVFVLSMLGLLLIAYFDPITWEKASLADDVAVYYFISRIPFIIPIVWLAIYAGRRHSQALRLEEDYAHKEVLSKSFEGYKRQLLDIEAESESKESTINLINQTLQALAVHPGRIYAGKHEDITLLSSLPNVFTKEKKEKRSSDDSA